MKTVLRHAWWRCALRALGILLSALVAVILVVTPASADEPFARSKDYDLQHSKIALKFDVEQKKVIGDVTHTISVLKEDTRSLVFDSVGLTIQRVTLNNGAAKYGTHNSNKTESSDASDWLLSSNLARTPH